MTTNKLWLFSLSAVISIIFICALLVPLVVNAAEQTYQITASERGFSPSAITVQEGDVVTLIISTADDKRNFVLSDYGISETIKKTGASTVTFTADTAGSFTFLCTTCEEANQSGTLVVQASEEQEDVVEEEEVEQETETITISGVTISDISDSAAIITWSTDVAGYGQVEYGTSSGTYIAATPLEELASTSHTAYLTGLVDNIQYFYRIKTQNSSQEFFRTSESTFTTEEAVADEDENEDEESQDEDEDQDEDLDEEDENEDQDEDLDEEDEDEDENADDEEEEDAASDIVYIATISDSTNTYKLTEGHINASSMKFDVGTQLTLTGYASPDAEITIEFCCAATRYSTTADSAGYWTFQGSPILTSGEQYVQVSEKNSDEQSKKIIFTVKGDEDELVLDSEEEEDGGFLSSINWVAALIIGGILLIIFSGVMFVRQMRR